jgi:hypothetical protein
MHSQKFSAFFAVLFISVLPAFAADKTFKALLVTGGCCHDYENQSKVLTEQIASNALAMSGIKVEFTVVNQGGTSRASKIPLYENKDWAKGFDIVVHNECFGEVGDLDWIKGIVAPHAAGLPAMVIHCSMHSYRALQTDEWREFVGVDSRYHESSKTFELVTLRPDHPVMKGFPEKWTTPIKDELYVTKPMPHCVPLVQAYGVESKKENICVWLNQYGKARVFGLTTGHSTENLGNPEYSRMISRGFLWALDRLEK